jgi:hypothetical protein
MDRLLEAQAQALHAGLLATAARPAVHMHQRQALVRELALCQAARTLAGYQRASGSAFELGRAVQLDRVAGRLRLACAMGDLHGAQAALTAGRRALEGTGPGDWLAALTGAEPAGGNATGPLMRCLLNLVLAEGGAPPLADARAEALAAWRALCTVDPGLARAAWAAPQRLLALQLRLPWRGAAARAVHAWLHALPEPAAAPARVLPDAEAELAALGRRWRLAWHTPTTPATDAGPEWTAACSAAEQAIAPWRALAAAAAPAVARVAARMVALCAGADCAPEVQRRLTASGLPAALAAAPLLAQADAMAARQARWPQPLLAAHAAGVRQVLAHAHTASEVELVAAHAQACLDVEADALRLFWAAALAPARAALRRALGAAGADADLRRATRLARSLFGLGPRALFELPDVASMWQHSLLPALSAQDLDSWQGEAGGELLPLLRAWQAANPGADGRRLFDPPAAAASRRQPRRLQLWCRPLPLAAWNAALGGPLRPPIPGWTGEGPGHIPVIR